MDIVPPEKEGEIWAVAGGKGGTGKSFIAASLGTHLAKRGKRVVLVDFDLGGANLHTFLGFSKPKKSLTDFFEGGVPLTDLALKTDVQNLSLITGDNHSLSSDNIKFTQKLKLFRQIIKLNAQHIVIDLGAGTDNNILDTFLIADKMIAILMLEVIAIENFYHFIKNALFRRIKASLKDYGFREILQHIWDRRESYGIKNIRELIDYLKTSFPYLGTILTKEVNAFKIYLVMNQTRNIQDIYVGTAIKSVLFKYLGIHIIYAGYIEYNDLVWRSVRERRPFMLHYLTTPCAKEIEVLSANLIQGKEAALPKI
jgi:flagellar biosynthesis protein FlhG